MDASLEGKPEAQVFENFTQAEIPSDSFDAFVEAHQESYQTVYFDWGVVHHFMEEYQDSEDHVGSVVEFKHRQKIYQNISRLVASAGRLIVPVIAYDMDEKFEYIYHSKDFARTYGDNFLQTGSFASADVYPCARKISLEDSWLTFLSRPCYTGDDNFHWQGQAVMIAKRK